MNFLRSSNRSTGTVFVRETVYLDLSLLHYVVLMVTIYIFIF